MTPPLCPRCAADDREGIITRKGATGMFRTSSGKEGFRVQWACDCGYVWETRGEPK